MDRGPDLAANLTGERSKHGGYALLIYQPGIFEKCVDLAIYARVMRDLSRVAKPADMGAFIQSQTYKPEFPALI